MAKTTEEKKTFLQLIREPVPSETLYSLTHNGQKKYKYYDTPDGQDIDKKLFVTTKYGLTLGSLLALVDNRMYSNPRTVFQTFNRAAWFIVPITGIWTTYAAITYTVTSLRGVDSPWNGGIGGAAAGSLLGVWMKDYRLGILTAVYAGLLCTVMKDANMMGHQLFDPTRIAHPTEGLRVRSRDYTRVPLGERGWTTTG